MQVNWNFVAVMGVAALFSLIAIVVCVCKNNRRSSKRTLNQVLDIVLL